MKGQTPRKTVEDRRRARVADLAAVVGHTELTGRIKYPGGSIPFAATADVLHLDVTLSRDGIPLEDRVVVKRPIKGAKSATPAKEAARSGLE